MCSVNVSRINTGTLRLCDPHQRWTCTFTPRRVCVRIRWTFLEDLLQNFSKSAGSIPTDRPPRGDSQLLEAGLRHGLWGSPKGRGCTK